MIIFDLDGTLADCEHRRHFVDPKKRDCCSSLNQICYKCKNWKPDWQSFYEACDKDFPIEPLIYLFHKFYNAGDKVEIWSDRSESVRMKTELWLDYHINLKLNWRHFLKMRPIGNTEPDDVLKERWLDEYLMKSMVEAQMEAVIGTGISYIKNIDFVFDDRPKVVRMWRRRGIFVFNCCQHDEEF